MYDLWFFHKVQTTFGYKHWNIWSCTEIKAPMYLFVSLLRLISPIKNVRWAKIANKESIQNVNIVNTLPLKRDTLRIIFEQIIIKKNLIPKNISKSLLPRPRLSITNRKNLYLYGDMLFSLYYYIYSYEILWSSAYKFLLSDRKQRHCCNAT